MSTDDPQNKVPAGTPPEALSSPSRSGAGAGTALVAMLKKRQMRAARDIEDPAPDGAKKPPGK